MQILWNKFNPIEIEAKASSKIQSYRDRGKNSLKIPSFEYERFEKFLLQLLCPWRHDN